MVISLSVLGGRRCRYSITGARDLSDRRVCTQSKVGNIQVSNSSGVEKYVREMVAE